MRERTKELFESLNLLRYAASHDFQEITDYEIQEAYYKIFDILASLKYVEDQEDLLAKYNKERQEKINILHNKVIQNFDGMGAIEIAEDISKRIQRLNINKQYVVSEMGEGQIGIIEGSNANNKKVVRQYEDKCDFLINIDDDLKTNFKREKFLLSTKKLSPNKEANIE